jgi:hypothetical protein
VQAIRVDTLISPSWVAWKEITVLGSEESLTTACVAWASDAINLRAEASTSSAVVGTIPAGRGAYVDGQHTDAAGFIWWQLLEGTWVRSDVVTGSGNCAELPAIE